MIPLRDENPLRNRAPVITVLLVVANVVFLYELCLGTRAERLVYEFGLRPVEITTFHNLPTSTLVPPYASLLTSLFVRGG